jgi:hypothetical protein
MDDKEVLVQTAIIIASYALGLAVLGIALMTNCCGGLSSEDRSALLSAASLNLQAYEIIDAGGNGSVPRALERGAYCATTAVLARNGGSSPEGGIQCKP